MPVNDITTIVWDGPCAVTESHAGIALGYYVDCDTAHCRNCIPDASAWARGDYAGWPGFEGWESPGAIFNDTESDTPTHCGICGAVIRHDLTYDGARYVMEAIAEFIAGDGHNPDVMAQWWDAYGEDEYALDHGDLTEIIRRAMVARGVTEYVPEPARQSDDTATAYGDECPNYAAGIRCDCGTHTPEPAPAPAGWTEYTCSGCGTSYSALPYDVPPHTCRPGSSDQSEHHPER